MTQEFELDSYKWLVRVFYLDGDSDLTDEILSCLKYCGCSNSKISQVQDLLRKKNTGVTFSNLNAHKSVMVIGRTTDIEECANTMIHERKHLEYHICQAFDIDPFSEEASYLAGEIGSKMYKYASVLLCKDCREKYMKRHIRRN